MVLRRLEQEDAVPLGGSQDDTSWSSIRGRHLKVDDGGELDLKMMSDVMEVHEDAYRLGGMWYLNNWIMTSKMTAEQWVDSTVGVGHGKRCQTLHDLQNSLAEPKPNPGLGFKNVSCPDQILYTPRTQLGISRRVEMDLYISTNLVGIKGAAGSRKRQRGGSGGWRSGRQEAFFPRQGLRQARRQNLRLGQGMIAAKSKDRYSKEQDIQVGMLEDSLDTSLQQMEVDTVDRTESQVDSVWCQWRQQNIISDKRLYSLQTIW